MRSMTSDYARAVKAAYEMRCEFDAGTARFDVFAPISILPNLSVCKYTTFSNILHVAWEELLAMVPSEDGFSFRRGKEYLIIYNNALDIPSGRQRFTIAHELGHYALGHHAQTEAEEREADCFARNLLAPRLLALAHGIRFENYSTVFGISAAAARMCEAMADEDARLAAGLYPFR